MTSDPLAPLTTALHDRATRAAAELLAEADAEADAGIDAARAEARRLLADARARGAADAAEVLTAEQTRAERDARAVVLAAQTRAYEHARQAARAAVGQLRDDPTYSDLLATLRRRATQRLGGEARIKQLPDGGIEATCGNRRLVYALEALADDLLDGMGPDLQELWAP